MIRTGSGNTILLQDPAILQKSGGSRVVESEGLLAPGMNVNRQDGTDVRDELAELGVRLENFASLFIVALQKGPNSQKSES